MSDERLSFTFSAAGSEDEWKRVREIIRKRSGMIVYCPYPDCTYAGTENEVDDHRIVTHHDEAQAGSNLTR